MKYLKQFTIILGISFLGELFKYILPFPIPASIYGMVIMLISLLSGVVKLEDVKDVSGFLIEIMPIMFVPAGVGLMASWSAFATALVPMSIITVVVLVLVMVVTGRTSQMIINSSKEKKEGKSKSE